MLDRGAKSPVVLWTRGHGCGELAALLGRPVRVTKDLREACIENRAELLVGRRIAADFDLVSTVVPVGFHSEQVGAVAAAVAGGPHSALAVEIAVKLSKALGIEAVVAHGYRVEADRTQAAPIVEQALREHPELAVRWFQADDMASLVQQLPAHSLLVLGAAGGALFQRIRFGPGARLRASAETGALVVKAAPTRVFQRVVEPVFVSPFREVGDTLRVHPEETLAVVDNGVLVGLVRRTGLLAAQASAEVGSVMEKPVSVRIDDPLDAAEELRTLFGNAPIPVTNGNDRLVGGLSPALLS
jgi:hypothetical protein